MWVMARPRKDEAFKDISCPNPTCEAHGLLGGKNITGNGKTSKGVRRYWCKACKSSFNAASGTFVDGLKSKAAIVFEALGLLIDGRSTAEAARRVGVRDTTVKDWMLRFDPGDQFFSDWYFLLTSFQRMRLALLQAQLKGERPAYATEIDAIEADAERFEEEP
jgi:transposase-like protein